ncbi:unnamed protein product [Sphagnum jensenii]|uniref:Uncharacterized protein n=1 Tax=Sphagnum jensenii TaxID=128206 RepID=A0ABP1A493_9BRYO
MNFPYLPLVKFHYLTPLLYMFPLHFLLSKNLLEVLCPLKSIDFIKCLHCKTHSHNLIFPLALWNIDSFPLNGLPEIPPLFSYSFAYPPASSRTLLLTYLSSLFSPLLELARRIVPPLVTEDHVAGK